MLYYAAKIFEAAGFSGGQEAAEASVLLGTFKLFMTLLAVLTVDKWGRRPLLLAGWWGSVGGEATVYYGYLTKCLVCVMSCSTWDYSCCECAQLPPVWTDFVLLSSAMHHVNDAVHTCG